MSLCGVIMIPVDQILLSSELDNICDCKEKLLPKIPEIFFLMVGNTAELLHLILSATDQASDCCYGNHTTIIIR